MAATQEGAGREVLDALAGGSANVKEVTMNAAIRQGKAKPGADELARTVKEGAIPIIRDVPSLKAYYVILAASLLTISAHADGLLTTHRLSWELAS